MNIEDAFYMIPVIKGFSTSQGSTSTLDIPLVNFFVYTKKMLDLITHEYKLF